MSPLPLPLATMPRPEGQLACLECGRCCNYVAVGINEPKSVRYATDVLWYLYHERVSVYLDHEGDWFVVFETRCRNLEADLKCAIYPQRPEICRGFDDRSCEVNAPDARARSFNTTAEFLEFVQGWRPRLYRQLQRDYVARPAVTPPGTPRTRSGPRAGAA